MIQNFIADFDSFCHIIIQCLTLAWSQYDIQPVKNIVTAILKGLLLDTGLTWRRSGKLSQLNKNHMYVHVVHTVRGVLCGRNLTNMY